MPPSDADPGAPPAVTQWEGAATTPSPRCAFVLPAELAAAWAARHRIREWLLAHRFREEFVDDVVYLVSEAVSNSAEHAYSGGDGTVEVLAEVIVSRPLRRQVRAEIRDRGSWRRIDPDPGHRGHGIAAMASLAQELTIRHRPEPGGTEVVLLSAEVDLPAELRTTAGR